jgi:hypothetical protein
MVLTSGCLRRHPGAGPGSPVISQRSLVLGGARRERVPQDGTDRDQRDAAAGAQHPSGSRRDLLVHRCAHRRDRPRPRLRLRLLRLLLLPRLVTKW